MKDEWSLIEDVQTLIGTLVLSVLDCLHRLTYGLAWANKTGGSATFAIGRYLYSYTNFL